MRIIFLVLLMTIFICGSIAAKGAPPVDILENDADAYDNDDSEKRSTKKSGTIVEDQQIFDEICTTFGTCYRDSPEGYKQCVNNCPESECYKCRGLTVKSVCCIKF